MTKPSKRVLVLAVVIGSIAACFAWSQIFPSATWRYKITIEVDTPEGVKTGSAVRQVTITDGPDLFPEATASKKPKGEAVVVDLGKRGVLFGLTSFDDYQRVFKAFPYSGGGTTPEGLKYYSRLKNVEAQLKPEDYPLLVRFRDINDPKTVERVDPENLTMSFGEGVVLRSVTLEMTDEKVTSKVDEYLSPKFWNRFKEWWAKASLEEKMTKADLFQFRSN